MKLARFLLALLAILAAGSAHAMQLTAVSGSERTADRDAIRSHIDKIFQAYIQKNADVIRATHAKDWTGFNQGSRTTIQGIDQYMQDAELVHQVVGENDRVQNARIQRHLLRQCRHRALRR